MLCNVIRDLMPVCMEGGGSEDSRKLIGEHIELCPECRKLWLAMQEPLPAPETAEPEEAKKEIGRIRKLRCHRILRTMLITALCLCILGFGVWYYFLDTDAEIPADSYDLRLAATENTSVRLITDSTPAGPGGTGWTFDEESGTLHASLCATRASALQPGPVSFGLDLGTAYKPGADSDTALVLYESDIDTEHGLVFKHPTEVRKIVKGRGDGPVIYTEGDRIPEAENDLTFLDTMQYTPERCFVIPLPLSGDDGFFRTGYTDWAAAEDGTWVDFCYAVPLETGLADWTVLFAGDDVIMMTEKAIVPYEKENICVGLFRFRITPGEEGRTGRAYLYVRAADAAEYAAELIAPGEGDQITTGMIHMAGHFIGLHDRPVLLNVFGDVFGGSASSADPENGAGGSPLPAGFDADSLNVDMSLSASTFSAPEEVTVTVSIENTGEYDMPEPLQLLAPDGTEINDLRTRLLAAGENVTWQGTWTVTQEQLEAGEITFRLICPDSAGGELKRISKKLSVRISCEPPAEGS